MANIYRLIQTLLGTSLNMCKHALEAYVIIVNDLLWLLRAKKNYKIYKKASNLNLKLYFIFLHLIFFSWLFLRFGLGLKRNIELRWKMVLREGSQ